MMSSLQFHPLFPLPVLLISALMLLAFLFVLTWKRSGKFFVVNVLLQLVVVLALLGLASRPFIIKEIDNESVILLTNNYDEALVDSLYTVLGVPHVLHQEGVSSFKKSTLLESFEELQGMDVFVVGEGITYYDLMKIKTSTFHYFPPKNNAGIQSLLNQELNTVNRMGKVRGVINNLNPNTTLLLKGSEGDLDSIHYSKAGQTLFDFKFRPKVVGDFVYQLEQRDSVGRILFSEPLPVSVLPERKLNILFLQDFPSVELRFLKNYLGDKGHRIAIRYGVSKNIDRSEFVNRASESLSRISSSFLEQFDLILVSAEAFDAMPQSTQRILAQSIKDGLGLVFLLESIPSNRVQELLDFKFTKTDQDTVRINLEDGSVTFPVASVNVNQDDRLLAILSNNKNIVEGAVSKGNGKVGFQLLQETYSLLLSGKQYAYAQVWTPLLEDVARKEKQTSQLKIITPFPWYEDEPLEVQLISSNSNPTLEINGIQTPLIEDTRIDGIWTTTIWPQYAGWNQLVVEGDSTGLNFYVSENEDWKSLRTINQVKVNAQYVAPQRLPREVPRVSKEEPVSPLLFFLLFLFASGGLWLLPKL